MNTAFLPATLAAGMLIGPVHATPALGERPTLVPDQVFVQIGHARHTKTSVVGLAWTSKRSWDLLGGRLGLYWEASIGQWEADGVAGEKSSAWVTQIGVTPVWRWTPSPGGPWYLEAGIGANVLMPVYRSRDKRFSTAFNFGDHLAVGFQFGRGRRHEVALRVQHFSNGGIKHPNPGEDFIQARYALNF